jgi:hypothetical protein
MKAGSVASILVDLVPGHPEYIQQDDGEDRYAKKP